MSRIGKKIIVLDEKIKALLSGETLTLTGPKGSLSCSLNEQVSVEIEGNSLRVVLNESFSEENAQQGLYRALIANMAKGVTAGFSEELEIVGVGYKVQLQSNSLLFNLGFSHTVLVDPPVGIQFSVEGQNKIKISGIDKQVVGQISSNIRALRPPDVYKGKGIRFLGEVIKKKQGKSVKK